jgi:hypothetical protein
MDFAKFVDLLEYKRLWLGRLDLLDDPREGLCTDQEFDRLSKRPDDMATSQEMSRSESFANCWHEADCESMAMWGLYGASARGVAIRTTMKSLRAAIDHSRLPIYIGRVKYVDWKQHDDHSGNLIAMWVRKDRSYGHESEVRLVNWGALLEPVHVPSDKADSTTSIDPQRIAQGVLARLAECFPSTDFSTLHGRDLVTQAWKSWEERMRLRKAPNGKYVDVDKLVWINEVVVGPKAQPWVLELARDVAKRYELSAEVHSSELFTPRSRRE